MWALVTNQGTAMPETALCQGHVVYPKWLSLAIQQAGPDRSTTITKFVDCTGNTELECIVCGESES